MHERTDGDWVTRFADEVCAAAEDLPAGSSIVCASGLSPSGPIHLGNLREVMTPHLVADEVRRRGYSCVHLLSWDDYDRFRKVPAGIDPSWEEHIGKPLTEVPPPTGSGFENWAEHFKTPMLRAMDKLGIEVAAISQTERYTSGAYRDQVLLAMRERTRIDGILARYRTKRSPVGAPDSQNAKVDEAEFLASVGSGAAGEDDGESAAGYYPYKPYCSVCGKDATTVTSYDDETTALAYVCRCGHSETVFLATHDRGKLVWKVDWPMRWAYEGVTFEPSGVDHSSPGSSFVVGTQIIREVFGARPPIGPMYAFVGISGMAKMSSSKGAVPTPEDALSIMETPVLRWLYARRRPNQSFKVAFDQEIHRLYDEWDALDRRVTGGGGAPGDDVVYRRSTTTAQASLPVTRRPVPFRTLASIVDITAGSDEQTLRILRQFDESSSDASLQEYEPRLTCAKAWAATQMPPEQRTRILEAPNEKLLADLDENEREMVRLLAGGLHDHWSLEGLTTWVYGVPKLGLGLTLDAAPSPELKKAQRTFFALLYQLLVGRETGPRLPTLLLAVGRERATELLTPQPGALA